jgi:hypothetical protein
LDKSGVRLRPIIPMYGWWYEPFWIREVATLLMVLDGIAKPTPE